MSAEPFLRPSPRVVPARAAPPHGGIATTIRGKILIAFCGLAAITAALGWYAARSVALSQSLVVATYDRPLMSISYARLALVGFTQMQLTLLRRLSMPDAPGDGAADARIAALRAALEDALGVARTRASSDRARALAEQTDRLVGAWDAERARVLAAGDGRTAALAALDTDGAAVLTAFDQLVEQTAEDGFRERERALGAIGTYRRLTLLATLAALVLGGAIAALLAGRMVRPIAAASAAATRIAAGELDVEIAPAGNDELGQLMHAMTVMRFNIRAMMQHEIAARRSAQAQLADAIASTAEAVLLVDPAGCVLTFNHQVAGFFPDLAGGLAAGARLPGAIADALAQPEGEIRLRDGRWARLSRSNAPAGGFVIIGSDISLLKERESVLQAAKEAAETASRAKSQFLASMSHELRTPLNAVIGFSELIVGETHGPLGHPKYRDYAADIEQGGRNLLALLNDILDVAKLQSKGASLRLEPTRVNRIIGAAAQAVGNAAATAGVTLTAHCDEDVPLVAADPARLRQILLTLLSNGLKFTPAGGAVAMRARRAADGICISVSDTGIGIAADAIPRALQPFGQADAGIERRFGGAGLGLSLAKLLAELHGGSLSIESAPGAGTTVFLLLPSPPEAPPAPRAVPRAVQADAQVLALPA